MLRYMQNLAQESDLILPIVVEDFRLTDVLDVYQQPYDPNWRQLNVRNNSTVLVQRVCVPRVGWLPGHSSGRRASNESATWKKGKIRS